MNQPLASESLRSATRSKHVEINGTPGIHGKKKQRGCHCFHIYPHTAKRDSQTDFAGHFAALLYPMRNQIQRYRRESPWVNHNSKKTQAQEAIGTHPLRSRKQEKGSPEGPRRSTNPELPFTS